MTGFKELVVPFPCISLIIWITLFSAAKPDCEKISAYSAVCPGQNYTEIPHSFEQAIEDLILPYNNITELKAQNLKQYSNVRNLNLDSNGIRSTHSLKAIHVLRKLRRLSISGNDIYNFDFQVFAQNVHLKEIIANDNTHIFIKEKCVSLPELESLFFNGNNMEEFPSKQVECFPNLRHLDMRNNKLRTLPSNIEKIFPKIEKILLSNNFLIVEELSPFILSRSDLINEKEAKHIFDAKSNSGMKDQSIAFGKSNDEIRYNVTDSSNGSNSGVIFAAISLAFSVIALSVVLIIVVIYFKNR